MSWSDDFNSKWINESEDVNIIAWSFAVFATFISLCHVIQHLVNFAMPGIQIYVVRILLIIPIYSISSACAIQLGVNGLYAETIRDIYEAFVLYSFLNLVMEFCGGETDCVYQIENDPPLLMPFPLCFLGHWPRDARMVRFCQRGVLQFIIVKPIMAVLTVIMIATDNYFNIYYEAFEAFVYNISYGWALYCLLVFYLATHHHIRKFKPLSKFTTVKIIIFATYYQSLAVKFFPIAAEDALRWNDFVLCLEMVLFALCLLIAFPVREFQGGIPDTQLLANMSDVLSVRDMVQDVYHNFMPTYHDYVVQRSEFEAPETVRVKTYLAGNLDSVALEMANRYRGRNKRLAFNALLRGSNPLFAKPRNQKRVPPRQGMYTDDDVNTDDHASLMANQVESGQRVNMYSEEEDLDVLISFKPNQHKFGDYIGSSSSSSSSDVFDEKMRNKNDYQNDECHAEVTPSRNRYRADHDEMANGITVTAVLDLMPSDSSKPANANSLNYISSKKVHSVHNTQTGQYINESIMNIDPSPRSDGEKVNEISLPYFIDPIGQTKSAASFLDDVATKNSHYGDIRNNNTNYIMAPKIKGFTLKRDEVQLEKIIDDNDDFTATVDSTSTIINNTISSNSVVEFECEWDSSPDVPKKMNKSIKMKETNSSTMENLIKQQQQSSSNQHRPSFVSPDRYENEILTEGLLQTSTPSSTVPSPRLQPQKLDMADHGLASSSENENTRDKPLFKEQTEKEEEITPQRNEAGVNVVHIDTMYDVEVVEKDDPEGGNATERDKASGTSSGKVDRQISEDSSEWGEFQ